MDWEAEGLLEGVEGDARDARSRLLDELHADGVGVEELRSAVEEDRLVLLPIERSLLADGSYTAAEMAAESGLPEDAILAIRRAIGLSVPEDDSARVFGERDLDAARRVKAYVDAGLPPQELLGVMRVMGDSMARSAEAIRTMFGRAYLQPGDSEHDLGRRYAEMADALLPLVAPDLEYLLRLHLREFTRNDAVGLAERHTGALPASAEVAVAFADLVGFTRLGEELPVEELSEIAARLAEAARVVIVPPARLIKTIGDAVMLVSPEPGPMLETVLALVEDFGDGELPPIRGGIAWGPAVARFGDWYGGTVNLASRVCTRARPGSVLTTEELRDALGPGSDAYVWSFAGQKSLKGISSTVPLHRVRRAEPASISGR